VNYKKYVVLIALFWVGFLSMQGLGFTASISELIEDKRLARRQRKNFLGFTPEQKFIELNQIDSSGNTSVMFGAGHGFVRTIRALLDGLTATQCLAIIARPGSRTTAVILAAAHGHVRALNVLIESVGPDLWIDLINRRDARGLTALEYAEANGHAAAVKLLLSYLTPAQ
jgi:ankyrin repeat protein